MKKLVCLLLFVTGTVTISHAQWNRYYYIERQITAGDAVFNNPRPGKAKVNFHFFENPGDLRITLELVSIKQMDFLPDLDSILNIARRAILHVSDSLNEDAINRKIDVLVDEHQPVQLRITNFADRPMSYFVQGNDLAILKTEQDTVRIKFNVPNGRQFTYRDVDGVKQTRNEIVPAFITIIVNNVHKIHDLPPGILKRCMELLRQDVTSEYVEKSPADAQYTAYYNLATNKRFSPQNKKWIRYGFNRPELVPNIYGSLQFVRGSFAPSMAAGIRYTTRKRIEGYKRFYLMWEPYFFFGRDADNKVVTDRNDFVTLRYIEQYNSDSKKGEFDFLINFSLGYLTRRQGNWFEKNTFKLGLPAVRSGWLQLEPEFYFNDLVRNFSPSLKLTLHYE